MNDPRDYGKTPPADSRSTRCDDLSDDAVAHAKVFTLDTLAPMPDSQRDTLVDNLDRVADVRSLTQLVSPAP